MNYPCKNCTERYRACHDTCEKYLAVKRKNDAINEARRKDRDIDEYIIGMIRRNRDHEVKRRQKDRNHFR